jgi:ribose transport system substrate-binding protein
MAMAGAGASACRRSTRRRVAVIPKSTAHIFWVSVHAGALEAGREFGFDILWNGAPTETEFSRQIQIVDAMVAQRVDGIAVAASDRKALVGSIDRAMAAGIPVTIFDSGLDSDNYTSFVATDNYEAGRLGARKLAGLLGGQGAVAVVMHAPGSQSTMDRERGFRDLLAAEFPGVRIVAEQFAMGDRARARAAAENMLAAHSKLDGFFASTEPASAGISLALKSRGVSGKVRFVGFDFSDAMVDDLRAGVMDAMVVQNPYQLGYEAVRTLHEKLSGREPAKRVDLPARAVTAAGLDDPEIQRILKPGAPN